MDLRRGGEFAFGSAVFLCGGAFLVLAIGRLSAPVVRVSAASGPVATTAVVTVAAPIAHSTIARIAIGSPIPRHRKPANKLMVKRTKRPAQVVRAPKFEPKATPLIATHLVRATDAPPRIALAEHTNVALVQRPSISAAIANSTAAPSPVKAGIAKKPAARQPRHRYGIAYVRVRPKAERTPEPPIGYDDRPTLVRSEGPSDTAPTMAPVQVELVTTHLGH